MKSLKRIFPLLLILCIFLATGAFLLVAGRRFADYYPDNCPESAAECPNPWTGWYQIYRYDLSDTDPEPLSDIALMAPGPGLALLEFNLQAYAEGPVSDSGLARLDALLLAWKNAGRQLIVRFLYDWDGGGLAYESEPSSLEQILTHMSQTAEILNDYEDCIYILQGAYIGSWGEMHSSHYANDEDLKTLMQHLDSVVSPGIFLAVRTPQQWRMLTGAADPDDVSPENTLADRLGIFNDGMLGSATDLDTYGKTEDGPEGKWPREQELAFLDRLGQQVPHGGEVVLDNPYNDLKNAAADLAAARVSYLNGSYDESVLNKWRATAYVGEAPFDGMNGYDYIARHLGYRYVLRDSSFTRPDPREREAVLSVTLENTGFSKGYLPFEVSLVLEHTVTGRTCSYPVPADTCSWEPGMQVTLNIPIDILDSRMSTGIYRVCLQILDPASGYVIRLANDATFGTYGCVIGYLEIRSLPKLSKEDLFSRVPVGKADDASV